MTDKDFIKAVVECDELPNCLKNEILNMEQNETTINGWVARNENGHLSLFSHIPLKTAVTWNNIDVASFALDEKAFPQITWDDSEPCEVEITIKIKEK